MKRRVAMCIVFVMVLSMLTSCNSILEMFGVWDDGINGDTISAETFWSLLDKHLVEYEHHRPSRWKISLKSDGESQNYTVIENSYRTVVYTKNSYGFSQWEVFEDNQYTIMMSDNSGRKYSNYEISTLINNPHDNIEENFNEYVLLFTTFEGVLGSYKTKYSVENYGNSSIYYLKAVSDDMTINVSYTITNNVLVSLALNTYDVVLRCNFETEVEDIQIPSTSEYTLVEDLLNRSTEE